MSSTRRQRFIQPALISSFSVTAESSDYQAIPADCTHVEIYAFMHQWFASDITAEQSAVQYMAQQFRSGSAEAIADRIEAEFRSKRIVAFATFMPELTAPPERGQDIDDATSALKLLIDVSRILKAREHPVQTIELVSGSRIQGIFQSNEPNPRYSAKRLTDTESIGRLVERLVPVAEYALKPTPVFLAVELEPGPLFILSGQSMLEQFCRSVESSGQRAVKRCVGLNLDIPHWSFLTGISPEWLESPESQFIIRRIVHAHVSDHHVGHLGDTNVGLFNDINKFRQWFSVLHRTNRQRRPRGYPSFSGFVSCEMEACRESRMIEDCYRQVKTLLSSLTLQQDSCS